MVAFDFLVTFLQYGVPALLTLWGAVAEFRARRFRKGLELTDTALRSVVSAIEVWGKAPGNAARAAELKATVKGISILTGAERERLAPVVEEVVDQLTKAGVFTVPDSDERIDSTAEVLKPGSLARREEGTL